MAGDSIGKALVLTTFGESHGEAIGGILDGYPAGIEIDTSFIQSEMDRRRPGRDRFSTQRKEADRLEILSGVFEGKSTGSAIGFMIRNEDQRSRDYSAIKDIFRPGHADYSWWMKYHNTDYRGGGRSSGRETASRVAAGALAKLALKEYGITVRAMIRSIGTARDESGIWPEEIDLDFPASSTQMAERFKEEIDSARRDSDSVGGTIECRIDNLPAGLGEPVFDRLGADLAKAVMSIGACRGFEFGRGFESAALRGSEMNDSLFIRDGKVCFDTNNSGGIQGGVSNGEPVVFRAAFRPTPSIARPQKTVTKNLEETTVEIKGRHDPCIVPRALVVVEAMASLVVLDHLLRFHSYE